ncbi:MAG: type II toxin-antitoxin system PemK/MazF family toxin [Propionibacteriaceae bacterium]|nr:type II toxin-antitoxin system PemK/MazF family toxin [Propionibacteriaceae bacterium]
MARHKDYPGDFKRMPRIEYAPHPGHLADPGEIVWAWVPYEEDHREGKVRPVLIIGWDGDWLLGAPLTSKDHDLDQQQEAKAGRFWVEIGTGAWDPKGRVSEARVNRIVRIDPDSVEEGGVRLDQKRFRRVTNAIRQHH